MPLEQCLQDLTMGNMPSVAKLGLPPKPRFFLSWVAEPCGP